MKSHDRAIDSRFSQTIGFKTPFAEQHDPAAARLLLIAGPISGASFEFDEKRLIAGRSDRCDFVLPAPSVSKRHCLLSRESNGAYGIEDLGSRNGTLVNGRVLTAGERVLLANGDLVTICEFGLMYLAPKASETVQIPPVEIDLSQAKHEARRVAALNDDVLHASRARRRR